jgi:hypothetical protein
MGLLANDGVLRLGSIGLPVVGIQEAFQAPGAILSAVCSSNPPSGNPTEEPLKILLDGRVLVVLPPQDAGIVVDEGF